MHTTSPTLNLLDDGQHVIWEEEGSLIERVNVEAGNLVVPQKILASSFILASEHPLSPGQSLLLQSLEAGSLALYSAAFLGPKLRIIYHE